MSRYLNHAGYTVGEVRFLIVIEATTAFTELLVFTDPGTNVPGKFFPGAMCVRLVDDQFVLRFTFFHAVRLGLLRPASLVIHRPELYTEFSA